MQRSALALAALGLLGTALGCRGDSEGRPAVWLDPDGPVALEPAAALDAAGRLWIAEVAWDEELRSAAVRASVPEAAAELVLSAVDPALPGLAALGAGTYLVFEARAPDGRALFGCELALAGSSLSPGPLERITPPGAPALEPHLVSTALDRLAVVFQAPRGASYDVLLSERGDLGWSFPVPIAATSADEWRPRCAPDGSGGLVVAWDAFDGESYDVHLAFTRAGRVEEQLRVASGPAYQGLPDVCVDPSGAAWVAWEAAPSFGAGGALRERRSVRLARVRRGAQAAEQAALGDSFGPRSDLPRVAWAGAGPVVVARVPARPYLPENPRNAPFFASFHARAVSFSAVGAPLPADLLDAEGGNAATESLVAGAGGALRCAFASDRRGEHFGPKNAYDSPLEERWRVGVAALRASAGLPALLPPVAEPSEPPRRLPAPANGVAQALLGDLHRHTNQSRCQGRDDGLRLDVWRYARGPGALDFVAITDHVQHLRPWSFWQTLRDTERYHDPPRLVTLFGVERNVQGEGHQNLVFRDRAAAEAGVASAPAQLDPELVVAIPHMTSQRSNPFGWERLDPERHRLVEVHQGNRGSYEGPGRPLAAEAGDVEGADLLSGLARGVHVGLVGSSDHASSAESFAGALAEERSREAVFAALRARRTYASTWPVRLDARLGALRIGGAGPVGADAALDVMIELDPRAGAPRLTALELVRNGVEVEGLEWTAGGTEHFLLTVDPRGYDSGAPLSLAFEGAAGSDARVHPSDAARGRLERRGDELVLARTPERVRVLVSVAAPLGTAQLRARLADSEELVALASIAVGDEVGLRALARPSLVRLWRLGAGIGSTREIPAPQLASGDTLLVRLTTEEGGLAWLSPFRITEVHGR